MQVVIIAGGLGTRIQGVAGGVPKSLVPVNGRPFAEYQLELLAEGGISDVLFCIGHLGDAIEAHVGDGSAWGVRVQYVREDPTSLMGSGGGVVNALPHLEEAFFTLYGDSYLPTHYPAVVAAFQESKNDAMMCVYRNQGQWDSSNTRIADGRVVFYSKSAKPSEVDYIDYGLTGFRREHIEAYAGATMPLDLATIQGDLVARGAMRAHEVVERFYEIGKPEGLAELEAHLRV
ncbi:MAG: NTP transferase domain-containing protein [Verrucomicrobia bacterium]|nr:NTP transferase domain-containing protein [Verrucomicrobiota bacterium]